MQRYFSHILVCDGTDVQAVRLGYCFTPYGRLWLYNGAPLVAFYDTLGMRRTYSRLKQPASSRGMCRRTEELKKKLYLRSGSQRQRYFAGFFNVPVLHRTGPSFSYGDSDTPLNLVAFYDTLGIRRTFSQL